MQRQMKRSRTRIRVVGRRWCTAQLRHKLVGRASASLLAGPTLASLGQVVKRKDLQTHDVELVARWGPEGAVIGTFQGVQHLGWLQHKPLRPVEERKVKLHRQVNLAFDGGKVETDVLRACWSEEERTCQISQQRATRLSGYCTAWQIQPDSQHGSGLMFLPLKRSPMGYGLSKRMAVRCCIRPAS
eukprot:1547063-Prymnesium_polylepis.1